MMLKESQLLCVGGSVRCTLELGGRPLRKLVQVKCQALYDAFLCQCQSAAASFQSMQDGLYMQSFAYSNASAAF